MSTQGIDLIYSANGTVVGANYYAYNPSQPAAWTFVVLFAGATLAHLVLIFPHKAAYFIPMVLGGIMETFGYYGRALSSTSPHNFGAWALQAFLIICAPPLLSATIYMTLSRIIHALQAEQNALLSLRLITPLFVTGDIIALASQIAGIGLQAARSESANATGKKVVLAGLIFQVVLFGVFVMNIVVFHRRNEVRPTPLSTHPQVPGWKRRVGALYVASGCVLVRNLVRAVEYGQGGKGDLITQEVYVYVFDAALMWVAMMAFVVFHPGRVTKGARRVGSCLEESEAESHPMVERI